MKTENSNLSFRTQGAQFLIKTTSTPAFAILGFLAIVLIGCTLLQFTFQYSGELFAFVVIVLLISMVLAFFFNPNLLRDSKSVIALKKMEQQYGDKTVGILPEAITDESVVYQPQASLSLSKPKPKPHLHPVQVINQQRGKNE